METARLQQWIDSCSGAGDMTRIAQAYLEGTVIRDPVAAEAWLMKAIETGDPIHSPVAMDLLARRILGLDRVIREEEVPILRQELSEARDERRTELEVLLGLV